eukprot:TRINITY_DN3424_c0_g1_i1.p1 TRINITY_DN3424_c0_g1~~TRINITY_DN3424_c0_g1_i1.p1  ORF type:complete len:849 (+),score=445.83 TRINITY_DN3424_c0_g1_i1:510-3056(+)
MQNVSSVDLKYTNIKPANLKKEDKEGLEDVGFLTSMFMAVMLNYAQTGHFGGPLAYTPANVAYHLLHPQDGGLRWDIRDPKHPFTDKFLMAGGHCIPTCYSLWITLYEAMARQYEVTKDEKYKCSPDHAMLAIDALGFRRSPGAVKKLLDINGLAEHPLFSQSKIRGIRALMGHSESTDVSNDVNGGPSGVGVAMAAGKALFWDKVKAPESVKVVAFEGEFALTEGHAQELKTVALSQKVGKRLRLFFSDNNAGIDDCIHGGVIAQEYSKNYDYAAQFASYNWNVFTLDNGNDYAQLAALMKEQEHWPISDKRPMVVVAKTVKGWWPAAKDGKIGSEKQVIGYPSHPYAFKQNGEYFVALAETFELHYGVKFEGIRNGAPKSEKERLIQFKTNIDIVLSILDKKVQLREWICRRLLESAATVETGFDLTLLQEKNPFKDSRLKVENLPKEKITVSVDVKGAPVKKDILLFQKPGIKFGARRATSEVGKWINYVTNNRWVTIAADLSNSINVEAAHFTGHYDPETNPDGTRLKAGIQEACNAATMIGLASQTLSRNPKEHNGFWGVSGTYGAFTPLMYIPLRSFSQQNQDSVFRLGVVTVIAGHSGPETAADARSHFGIFAPQVWTLFPRGHIINLYFWDYNDVAPGYFAAAQLALARWETGIIVVHVARPDSPVADRSKFADSDILASSKGVYLIREFDPKLPKMGTVFLQGSSATVNTVALMDKFNAEGINVRLISVISQELFNVQPKEYQQKLFPESSRFDCMVVTTMTKRVEVLPGLGPLTEEYSVSSDFDDCYRTGGLEEDIIEESRLDEKSIYNAITRFAKDHDVRIKRQLETIHSISGQSRL